MQGFKPTVMISGDVMELHHLIYAEREAHAAEVARLRAALANHRHTDACRNYAAEKRHAHCITECRDSYAALAAPPTAAVEAVDGMRKALEHQKNALHILLDRGCRTGESDVRLGIKQIDAALAAWKEATRG